MAPFPLPALALSLLCAGSPLAPPESVKPQDPVVKPEQKPPAQKPNRLAKESSPYLRQHQHNPVDWYPWGAAALERAKKEDKPIFLSIGYAACHWCHVMAAESFADPAIAAVMNENFVCIKVDREERPDIDEIYMAALQAMGQHGGWPLSAWLTPDGRPFYGGTYYPPEDAHGRPGFRRVLEALAKAWREKKNDVNAQAD
ncbi:MAG TPA: thioredoxin domain-containing protein, partial [Planctomycetota bacterium]|nr:thioredoxin domain-containing protein [Planctomycetota bacterium]